MPSIVTGVISHWLCVHCDTVQPEIGVYPWRCWLCDQMLFIRDTTPYIHAVESHA